MRQAGGSVEQVYCDMTGGRWNELLRRGADAEKTAIPTAEELSFSGSASDATAYQGLHGDLRKEFFVGKEQLSRFSTPLRNELLVEVETTDSEYYYAVFRVNSLDPLDIVDYRIGTAGSGFLDSLNDAPFNTQCSQVWFSNDCSDLNEVRLPQLTRPLGAPYDAAESARWPTVTTGSKALKRVSMKVRVNQGEFCTRQTADALALSPAEIAAMDVDIAMQPSVTTPEVAGDAATATMETTVTITCKDSAKVITTKNQYNAKDYASQAQTMTMNCQRPDPANDADFDDLPISKSAICMTPCKPDYTLVAPTDWQNSEGDTHSVDRLACLSPIRGPAGRGPYQAAKACGAAGEQLLDFPVPRDRLADNPDNVGFITAMHYSLDPADNKMKLRDLRGTYMSSHLFDAGAGGDYKAADRCVGLFVDDPDNPTNMEPRQTACYNEELRFVCMSSVGCRPDQFWLEGFCYDKLAGSSMADHQGTCYPEPLLAGGRNGMPAVPTEPLLNKLAEMEAAADSASGPVAVGAYRRHDGFYKMEQLIPDAEISGIADDEKRCAELDMTAKQLSAIACDDASARPVICQYPGLPTDECPTNMKEVYGSATDSGDKDRYSLTHVATFTARSGFNFYEQKGPHALSYTCGGLLLDWELTTDLSGLQNQDVNHWTPPQILACTTEDRSGYPANSAFTVTDRYLVHRCASPLQAAGAEVEQQQTCDHSTYLFTGAVTDCDECMMDPLDVDTDMPMTRTWEGGVRKLDTQVNYTCSEGLTTANGSLVQQQVCTLSGWVGDVAPCDTCEWLDSFNTSSNSVNVTGGLTLGGLVEMWCEPGLEAADGAVFSSAVCTPDFWNMCHENFTCDHCHGPPVNHTAVAFVSDSDWDGSSRQQGTLVTYSCEGSSVTETGQQLQYQNCTEQGWVGEVLPCGVCPGDPPNATDHMTRFWNGSRTNGAEATYSCNAGTSTAQGDTVQNQTCITSGWSGALLPCDTCVGEPANVTGLTTINSSFTGESSVGTEVTYTCQGPLSTAEGQVTQWVNCTEDGWRGSVTPCEVCPAPPAGNHSTIRQVVSPADHRLGSAVRYRCNHHLSTADGHSEIVAVCERDGWSVCETDIQCNYCSHLGDVSQFGGTLSWNYTGVRTLGTKVLLTCHDGLATPDLQTNQTLTCGLDGWNRAVACSICTDPVPTPPSTMKPNVTWTLGDATATYTCLDTKKLAWGLTQFEMTCSPAGWPCAPSCDHCAATPPPPAGLFPTTFFDSPGGRASYQCVANMQTALNQTQQSLTCGDAGWEGQLLPCDECIGDVTDASPGQNRTWSGNTTVGTSVIYECLAGKETRENTTYQTRNCTEQGWTPPPIPCDLCVPPPHAHGYMTRDWDGNRTVNSTATYTCSGNLTTMANETEQTITCTDLGWSDYVRGCALCREPIPEPGNYTERNVTAWRGWRHPGAVVEYTCHTGAVQTATCTGAGWEPPQLPPCSLQASGAVGPVGVPSEPARHEAGSGRPPVRPLWSPLSVTTSAVRERTPWLKRPGSLRTSWHWTATFPQGPQDMQNSALARRP